MFCMQPQQNYCVLPLVLGINTPTGTQALTCETNIFRKQRANPRAEKHGWAQKKKKKNAAYLMAT